MASARGLLLIAACLLVIGCNQTPPSDTASSGRPAAGKAIPLTIEEVRISPGLTDAADTIPEPITSADEILVSVRPNGAAKGGELAVKLINLANGQQAGLQKASIQPGQTEPVALTFKSERPWSPGRFLVEITLDGKLAEHRDVDIIEQPPSAAPSVD